jgi:hypothetical protein
VLQLSLVIEELADKQTKPAREFRDATLDDLGVFGIDTVAHECHDAGIIYHTGSRCVIVGKVHTDPTVGFSAVPLFFQPRERIHLHSDQIYTVT